MIKWTTHSHKFSCLGSDHMQADWDQKWIKKFHKKVIAKLVSGWFKAGNPYWRGRLGTVHLIVLTSLDNLIYILKILFTFAKKTSYLNEEVNCTDPSLAVSIPCLKVSLRVRFWSTTRFQIKTLLKRNCRLSIPSWRSFKIREKYINVEYSLYWLIT
jgi:hypothetical protein